MSRAVRVALVTVALAGLATPVFASAAPPPCTVQWEPWLATGGALPPLTIYRPYFVC